MLVKLRAAIEGKRLVSFASRVMAISALRHPSIAPLLDRGQAGDGVFVVREWFADGSLAQTAATLDATAKLRVAIDVAQALEHSHRHGLSHGSIKAENVFVESKTLLVDFVVDPQETLHPKADQKALADLVRWLDVGARDAALQAALDRARSTDAARRFAHLNQLVTALEQALAQSGVNDDATSSFAVVRTPETIRVETSGRFTLDGITRCVEEIGRELARSKTNTIAYVLDAQGGCHGAAIDAIVQLHRRHRAVLKRVAFCSRTPEARGMSVLIGSRVDDLPWKTFSTNDSMVAWLREAGT